jgi:hypothetical protein
MTELMECPRHGGSFDCNPFCDLCEGNQEYLREGRILTPCSECENETEVWDDDPRPLCEWCSHAEECKKPKNIRLGSAHFTGTAIATCSRCNFKSVLWDCHCDLEHICDNY